MYLIIIYLHTKVPNFYVPTFLGTYFHFAIVGRNVESKQ